MPVPPIVETPQPLASQQHMPSWCCYCCRLVFQWRPQCGCHANNKVAAHSCSSAWHTSTSLHSALAPVCWVHVCMSACTPCAGSSPRHSTPAHVALSTDLYLRKHLTEQQSSTALSDTPCTATQLLAWMHYQRCLNISAPVSQQPADTGKGPHQLYHSPAAVNTSSNWLDANHQAACAAFKPTQQQCYSNNRKVPRHARQLISSLSQT